MLNRDPGFRDLSYVPSGTILNPHRADHEPAWSFEIIVDQCRPPINVTMPNVAPHPATGFSFGFRPTGKTAAKLLSWLRGALENGPNRTIPPVFCVKPLILFQQSWGNFSSDWTSHEALVFGRCLDSSRTAFLFRNSTTRAPEIRFLAMWVGVTAPGA
jgi:hypothetical protein